MLNVEEEDEGEWIAGKYSDNPEENTPDEDCILGEEAIERVASGLGGRVVSPIVLPAVQQFAMSADWKHRRAAVAALLRLAEGLEAGFQPYLNESISYYSKTITEDPSWRVRYEAIEVILGCLSN